MAPTETKRFIKPGLAGALVAVVITGALGVPDWGQVLAAVVGAVVFIGIEWYQG